jgi:dihydroorotate dehydrogenase
LQRLDPERAHELAVGTLRIVTAIAPLRWALRRYVVPHDPALEVEALGQSFPSPLGVAAGVDKDATWFEGLGLLGFGFVEIGTVTAEAQSGNPRPRVFRMAPHRALLNKMGFPNAGADAVAERMHRRSGRVVVGVNVGKSRKASLAQAGDDYRAAVRKLAPLADYIAINVSSPNTPGLRQLQAVDVLGPLVADVRSELDAVGVDVPLLIKIGPDSDDAHIDAIAEMAIGLSLDGIVCVNTTEERGELNAIYANIATVQGGGVSGAPLKTRALEVLERLYAKAGKSLVLISVGGIGSPEDAWQRILAGATLVQAYTGFVYGGPGWPSHVNRVLAQKVRDSGKSSIQELIGAGASWSGGVRAQASGLPVRRQS